MATFPPQYPPAKSRKVNLLVEEKNTSLIKKKVVVDVIINSCLALPSGPIGVEIAESNSVFRLLE